MGKDSDRSDPTAPPPEGDPLLVAPTHVDGWPPDGAAGATLAHIRIGKYQLRRQIAVGGMGSVYEAVQDQPRRVVALKILRAALPSPAAVRRFEKEAQLLARLQHPGIAQVIEAGTHEHEARPIPYIAMEFVAGGKPITVHAEAHRLDRRARLGLFVEVCDAVHHGHTRGIIHRDLKPSNILVDQDARVKVIDFGVSRTLDADPASYTVAMESGQIIGTLQYMAPEQCDRAADAGTGADVYALGVVLYELLTGRLPYDVVASNLAEAVRVIREQPPVPPSRTDRTLRGDLETIVLKALHKSPERRYASAHELAEDVRRHLAGDPIAARRDSIRYIVGTRLKKFVARHQVGSLLAACLIAAVCAQTIAVPLVFRWTPLNRAYENFLLRTFPAPASETLHATRLITLAEGTDVEALARRHGVEGVTAADRTSLRRLHGKLMQRLVDSGARVVAFDIAFPNRTPHDAAFVAGVAALRARGVDVVVLVRRWSSEPDTLSPDIAPHVRWGGDAAGLGAEDAWYLVLFAKLPDAINATQCFALTTLASYQQPGADVVIEIDVPANRLTLRYVGRPTADEVVAAGSLIRRTDAPEFGLPPGTVQGRLLLEMPEAPVIRASTVDYADVLDASPEQLRRWFDGRAVVIGDTRAVSGDGPFPHPDRDAMHGCWAQAVGVDALIRGRQVAVPATASFYGVGVPQSWALVVGGALLGAAVALLVPRRSRLRWGALVVLAVAATGVSLVAFAHLRYLFNPLVPIIAMLVAAALAARAIALRRRMLG